MSKKYTAEILILVFLVVLYSMGIFILTINLANPTKEWATIIAGTMGLAGALASVIGIYKTTIISIEHSKEEFKERIAEERKENLFWRMLDELYNEQNKTDLEIEELLMKIEKEKKIKSLLENKEELKKVLKNLEYRRKFDLYQLYLRNENKPVEYKYVEESFRKFISMNEEKINNWIITSREGWIEDYCITPEDKKIYNLFIDNPAEIDCCYEKEILSHYYEEWKEETSINKSTKVNSFIDIKDNETLPSVIRDRLYLLEKINLISKQLAIQEDRIYFEFYKRKMSKISLKLFKEMEVLKIF